MIGHWRRVVGWVLAGGAVLAAMGFAEAEAQTGPRDGFIRTKAHYIHRRYVTRVDLFGDPQRADVHFTDGKSLTISAEEAGQLFAALDREGGAEESKAGASTSGPLRVVARDEFEGKLGLNWKPVRPDPSHVSLTKHPGALTIITQRGSIHGEEKKDESGEGIQAKNLYLIDNPLAPGGDFALTTCVSGFTPETTYQQAGLIVYGDDDNYLKFGYEYNWPDGGGQKFCILVETGAKSDFHYVESESGLTRYWLRLTKRGDRYEYATSIDGKTYRVHGEATWGDGSPMRFGLLAKNGGDKEAGELDASFEFFELLSPAPGRGERKD